VLTLEAGSSVTGNTAGDGGGIWNYTARFEFDRTATAALASEDIVTDNHLTDETTVSNCAPVDTVPNCFG
jgi:hypothetical protein